MSANWADSAALERLLDEPDEGSYVLQLFVSGMTPRSTAAIHTVKELCDDLLAGRYTLQIIDLYDDPQTARAHRVLASPTLIRQRPLPARRLIGNISDRGSVLRTLGIA